MSFAAKSRNDYSFFGLLETRERQGVLWLWKFISAVIKIMNQLRRHKWWHCLHCAACPGLVSQALRHLSTWPVHGPGQIWSAGLTGWKLSFCQLLQSRIPAGPRKSRITSTVSRNGLRSVCFSYSMS